MRKGLLCAAGVLCGVFLATGVSAGKGGADSKARVLSPMRIAGAFALTGGGAALDREAADGAKLAVREINAGGGVLGRTIEFIVKDTQYKADEAARVGKQFVELERVVAGIGFADTDSVLAIGPSFQARGIPFVSVGATSPGLPQQVGDTLFLACFGDNTQAAAGAEFALKNFGKTAYLLWDKDMDFTVLLAGYFKTHFQSIGGSVVLEDRYDDRTTDFSGHVARIKALPEKPDFYYVSAMPYNVGEVIRQLREAGITGPIMGGDGYDTPDLIKMAGPASDNVYFTTHALMDPEHGTVPIRNFIAAFRNEYYRSPANAFAALGYDAMRLVADAASRAGSAEPAAIRKALEQTTDFPGVTGSITLSPGSHVPRKGVTLIQVKEGRLTRAGEIVPREPPSP